MLTCAGPSSAIVSSVVLLCRGVPSDACRPYTVLLVACQCLPHRDRDTADIVRELGAAITVIIASIYGIPVSTTMCITGAGSESRRR